MMSQPKYRHPRQTRSRSFTWARRLYVGCVVLYTVLAVVMVAAAYAQPRSSTMPMPSQTQLRPPAGSSDAVVERYFDYLALQNFGNLTETYHTNWVGLLEAFAFGGAFLVVLYFFVFAWFARRKSGDLYPVEVYNGYITERNGGIDAFNWALYAVIAVYAVTYIAVSLRFGQIY